MAPIIPERIRIDHIVDSTKEYSSFVTARDTGDNKLRIFLINEMGIYVRNAFTETWQPLIGALATSIRETVIQARDSVPVYKVNAAYSN